MCCVDASIRLVQPPLHYGEPPPNLRRCESLSGHHGTGSAVSHGGPSADPLRLQLLSFLRAPALAGRPGVQHDHHLNRRTPSRPLGRYPLRARCIGGGGPHAEGFVCGVLRGDPGGVSARGVDDRGQESAVSGRGRVGRSWVSSDVHVLAHARNLQTA